VVLHTWCGATDKRFTLGEELRKLVEARIDRTLRGIEETLRCVVQEQEMGLEDLRSDVQSLERSFSLLSQRWNLEILYTLFLRNDAGFSELKRVLGVNSRSLSDKLKSLASCGYVERRVKTEPPLRVEYALRARGRNLVLLALPLLYYSRAYPLGEPDRAESGSGDDVERGT
jgi:DNA-binding HxlR family transcriptional regulator